MSPIDNRTDDEKRAGELIAELRLLHERGKLPPENPFHQTVGSMIWRAREEKGISRAHLAKATGISQNSLAKYEKAGGADGQYPPLPKMALLCKELELDPREVMLRTFSFQVINNEVAPDFFAFDDFLSTLDLDNRKLKHSQIVNEEMGEIVQKYRDQRDGLLNKIRKLEQQVLELSAQKQNDPDHDDPSRPEMSSNNAEAAATASTRPMKGKD